MKVLSAKGRHLWRFTDYSFLHIDYTSCGKHSIKIDGKDEYERTSMEVTYYIVPKPNKIKGITSPKKNYITIKYSDSTGADGYQIQCSSSSKFPDKDTRKIKSTSSDSATIKCDSGTYYFRIRPYIVDDGKRIFGKWSDVYKYTVPKENN